MPLERASDIMIPLEEYAVVDEDATMVDALVVLERAQDKVPEGKQPHRAVLVRGKNGAIKGKLGHHAFLAGLEPHYGRLGSSRALSQSGFSGEYLSSIMEEISLWNEDFGQYVRRAKATKVADVMIPIKEHVELDDPIGDVLHKLITHNNLSLIVTSGGVPVGVVRLSDLFSVIAKLIKRRAAEMDDTHKDSE